MPVLALGSESLLGGLVMKSLQRVATNVQGGAIPQCGHWIATEGPNYITEQFFSSNQ